MKEEIHPKEADKLPLNSSPVVVAVGRLIPKSILVAVVVAVPKLTAARHARRLEFGSPLHTCIADRRCRIAVGPASRLSRPARMPPLCRR